MASTVVSLISAKSIRETLQVSFFFDDPLLDWREVYPRFFQMIYSSFAKSGKAKVQTNELSVNPGVMNIGDLRARWSIYGGASSVTLYADKLTIDFPVLTPVDYSVAQDILRTIHDSISAHFENLKYSRIDTQSFEHLEIPPTLGVSQYLEKFRRKEFDAAFTNENAISQPAMKARIAANDGTWTCDITVERSLFSAAAVFIGRNMTFNKIDQKATFDEKLGRAQHIAKLSLAGIGLEYENVTSS